MKANLLSITHYDETGWKWHNERVELPAWGQIEKSIRQMDRFRQPFVHLHLQADVLDTEFLAICGGDGIYAPAAALNGSYPNYYDVSKSDDEIAVWTSDQGCYPEEKYVCYDLNLVLKIAHHYAQFGELSPAVVWQ